MTCNNQQKSSENLLNKRAQIFKNIRCELCVTCRRRTDFSRCLRHDAPTKTSTYTDSLIRCMCVCLFILWWAMEVSPATAYCCVPLVLTGREGLWDRSGDSGLSEYSRCCQSFLLHTSHFLGHYACCTHNYINRWTIKKKSIMKPGTVEGIDIFNNWKWNIYEIRIFTASKPKEK